MAANINIGAMRKTITISRLSQVKDAYGATTDTYSDVMTIKAALVTQKGALTTSNFEIFNTNILTFLTYYRTILPTDRIKYNNLLYKIMDITEIGYRTQLQITCELINV